MPTSQDNQLILLDGVSETTTKRASQTGIASLASGVLSASAAPTITDFTNMAHDHGDADDGGALVAAALPVMVGDSGSGGTKGAVPAPASGDAAAGKFLKADGTWAAPAGGGGGGDASTNTSTSVDSEVALFSGTGGKTLKRATGSGIAKLTSGVQSTIAIPADATKFLDGSGDFSTPAGGYGALASAFYVKDDFPAGAQGSGQLGELGWAIATGTTSQIAELGHPGIVERGVTASGTYAHTVLAETVTSLLFDPAAMFDMTFYVRPNQNDTTEVIYRLGCGNTGSLNPPTHGIYIEKLAADANWFWVVRKSNVQTRTDTTVAVAVAWTKFRIRRIDASTIGFTINGGTEMTTTSANIPTATEAPFFAVGNTTAVTRTIDVDYFEMAIASLSR